MKCPKCESEKIVKNGKVTLKDNSSIQKYRCRGCTQRFNERKGVKSAWEWALPCESIRWLQRVLDVQRLIHNWVKPHWGLGKYITPSMAMGYSLRPFSIHELLTQQHPFIHPSLTDQCPNQS